MSDRPDTFVLHTWHAPEHGDYPTSNLIGPFDNADEAEAFVESHGLDYGFDDRNSYRVINRDSAVDPTEFHDQWSGDDRGAQYAEIMGTTEPEEGTFTSWQEYRDLKVAYTQSVARFEEQGAV
jgi:hypothetical protein